MLKLFEVIGFKNFKDRIRLDFSDIRDYKFNSACITNHIIGKMIIYGKNSIGKSNFGLAIFDIVSHLSSKNVTPNSCMNTPIKPTLEILTAFVL